MRKLRSKRLYIQHINLPQIISPVKLFIINLAASNNNLVEFLKTLSRVYLFVVVIVSFQPRIALLMNSNCTYLQFGALLKKHRVLHSQQQFYENAQQNNAHTQQHNTQEQRVVQTAHNEMK